MKAEKVAAKLAAAFTQAQGITKSAGSLERATALMMPIAEAFCACDEKVKLQLKAMKRLQRDLKALATPAASWSVPPRRMVDYRPEEWRTTLTPAARPANGHDLGLETNGNGDGPPDWHPDWPVHR